MLIIDTPEGPPTFFIRMYRSGEHTGCTSTAAWPCYGECAMEVPGARYTSVAVKPRSREFDWFRDFERALASAERVPEMAVAVRIWRRLRGADAAQVRRHKRRRFVQTLAGALA
jgi:hypothetical protein